jgi:hypothetical protein
MGTAAPLSERLAYDQSAPGIALNEQNELPILQERCDRARQRGVRGAASDEDNHLRSGHCLR